MSDSGVPRIPLKNLDQIHEGSHSETDSCFRSNGLSESDYGKGDGSLKKELKLDINKGAAPHNELTNEL